MKHNFFGGLHAIKDISKEIPAQTAISPKKRTLFFGKTKAPQPSFEEENLSETAPLVHVSAKRPHIDDTPTPPSISFSPPPSPPSPPSPPMLWGDMLAFEPQTIANVICMPETSKQKINDWIVERSMGIATPTKLLVICGPSGCAKRTLVRVVARSLKLQCVEHEVLDFADVLSAVTQGAASRGLHLGDAKQEARIFLFTGVDGFLTSEYGERGLDRNGIDASSCNLVKLLHYLEFCGASMPPVVFTVHDLDGKCGRLLRHSKIVQRYSMYRIDPMASKHYSQRSQIQRMLSNVCHQVGANDISEQIMASFDGDLKQTMLRLEFALRSSSSRGKGGKNMATTIGLVGKDFELVDTFETARLLLDTTKRFPFDFLGDAYKRFAHMETLMRSNYMAGVSSMKAAAECAEMFSFCDQSWPYSFEMDKYSMLVMGLRTHRALSKARLPTGNLAFIKSSLHFDSIHTTLQEYKVGSMGMGDGASAASLVIKKPIGPIGPIGNKTTTDLSKFKQKPFKEMTFTGNPEYFRLSDYECYERLCLLKRVYASMSEKEWGKQFYSNYGVSLTFMRDFMVMVNE
jgi:hypothetical protein